MKPMGGSGVGKELVAWWEAGGLGKDGLLTGKHETGVEGCSHHYPKG
jgi:hypothetical protein